MKEKMKVSLFKFKEIREGICPICEDERKVEVGERMESLLVRGQSIEFMATVERCKTCGEFFATSNEEEANFQKAYRLYRERNGLLQPEEIRQIREKYEISQRTLGRLLGWGDVTIHRYESGAIQDEAHNEVLLFLQNPENFRAIFEKNKNRLPERMIKNIEIKIGAILEGKSRDLSHSMWRAFFGSERNDIYSGFRVFDFERFEAAILYFCKEISKVSKTKLNKLIWYFDFSIFKTLNRSATGAVYVHLPYGPVPNNYEIYLAHMVEEERNLRVEEVLYSPEKGIVGDVYRTVGEPDLSVFSPIERERLEKVAVFFSNLSAKSISDYSHLEEAYKNTKENEPISYDWAKSLRFDI
ncbi:MAG: type II TA system antitoxin MqsA family protein [Nitrospiria bacterium]